MRGLRQVAFESTQRIMQSPLGFKNECTITDPNGSQAGPFSVRSNDISLTVDPGTDQLVMGRQATVVILISDLIDAGFSNIEGTIDDTKKPWLVDFANINGVSATYKVVATPPDHTLGLRTLLLEGYDAA